MGFYKDLKGQRFGYLTVLWFAGQNEEGQSMWRAECKCGQQVEVRGNSLTSGNTKSCGDCGLRRLAIIEACGKHEGKLTGAKWSALTWNAKSRGHDVKITQREAAAQFNEQAGQCALSGVDLVLDAPMRDITASLDRIDSSKGYELGNIQWIHKDINLMKNQLPQEIFLGWVEKIHTHKAKA